LYHPQWTREENWQNFARPCQVSPVFMQDDWWWAGDRGWVVKEGRDPGMVTVTEPSLSWTWKPSLLCTPPRRYRGRTVLALLRWLCRVGGGGEGMGVGFYVFMKCSKDR
jgi:hypothetical protein